MIPATIEPTERYGALIPETSACEIAGMPANEPSTSSALWTKVCGIRDVATARAVAAQHPAAIGLNFFPKSARYVDDATAGEIASAVSGQVELIGVFVNEPIREVIRRVRDCGLTGVQFHGGETPDEMAEVARACPQVQIIRAHRRKPAGLQPLVMELTELSERGVICHRCLIDAYSPHEYGGTGLQVPWSDLRGEVERLSLPPMVLAGGLTPENIGEAIRTAQPHGVDVASGVESSPGVKDLRLVSLFLERARSASC